MRYCVIFVRRCFALCTTKLGQYTSSLSICSSAVEYRFESRTRSHCRRGACARSGVLIYKYTTPSFSRTVAYRELARGHDCRLHRPVRLYSLRQNVWCVDDLILYEQKWCPMSDHTTSSDCIVTVASKKSSARFVSVATRRWRQRGGGGGPPGNALQEWGAPMATGARALRPRPSGARCAFRRSGAPRATPACRPPACHPRRAPPRQTR